MCLSTFEVGFSIRHLSRSHEAVLRVTLACCVLVDIPTFDQVPVLEQRLGMFKRCIALLLVLASVVFSGVFSVVFPSRSYAALQIGTGLSSAMSGRIVPGLEVGFDMGAIKGTVNTVGVSSSYYYHTSYAASVFRTWNSGQLFWGDVQSGVGGGLMYAVRGFRDEGSLQEEQASDFTGGPAFFVQWNVLSPVYLKLEMIMGLRDLTKAIGLNAEDIVFFSMGVSSW